MSVDDGNKCDVLIHSLTHDTALSLFDWKIPIDFIKSSFIFSLYSLQLNALGQTTDNEGGQLIVSKK